MWNDFISYYFWFIPPSTILTYADKLLIVIFLGVLVLGIACRITMFFINNQINRKLLKKIWLWGLTIGLIGLLWGLFRFQNIPIFGRRMWAGLDLVLAIVWVVFILKYAIFSFRSEKIEYERELVKSKYLPKPR